MKRIVILLAALFLLPSLTINPAGAQNPDACAAFPSRADAIVPMQEVDLRFSGTLPAYRGRGPYPKAEELFEIPQGVRYEIELETHSRNILAHKFSSDFGLGLRAKFNEAWTTRTVKLGDRMYRAIHQITGSAPPDQALPSQFLFTNRYDAEAGYRLKIRTFSQGDNGRNHDAGATFDTALALESGGEISGILSAGNSKQNDDEDFYRLGPFAAGTTIKLELLNVEGQWEAENKGNIVATIAAVGCNQNNHYSRKPLRPYADRDRSASLPNRGPRNNFGRTASLRTVARESYVFIIMKRTYDAGSYRYRARVEVEGARTEVSSMLRNSVTSEAENNRERALPSAQEQPEMTNDYLAPPFLALEAASFPREPIPGLPITMAFRVENISHMTAAAVSVKLQLSEPKTGRTPGNLTIGDNFCTALGENQFRCNLGDISPGAVGDLIFTAETPMTGAVVWTANFESAGELARPLEYLGMFGARAPPNIVDVVVLHDQTGIENEVPLYDYPHGPNSNGGDTRHLLVIGHNLPQRPVQNLTLQNTDTINYAFVAFPDTNNPPHRKWFDIGWKRFYGMENAAAARARAERDGYDAVLVRADLLPGILPGLQTVNLSGAEGHWGLEFGDLWARLSFVRLLPNGGLDLLRNAYMPERIHLAVETNIPLPLEEIPVYLNAEHLGAGQRDEIALVARRSNLGNGRIYLSGPIDLHRQGSRPSLSGGMAIAAIPSDENSGLLQGRIDATFRFNTFRLPLRPAIASVAVGITPTDGNHSWLWHDGLNRAAVCNEDIAVQDWGALSVTEAKEIWNIIVFSTREHRLGQATSTSSSTVTPSRAHLPTQSVKFGHHAATILMRDLFLSVMERQVRKLDGIRNNRRSVLKLIEDMKPLALTRRPLLRMRANNIDGGETDYRYVILNDVKWLADLNGKSEAEIMAWRERETVTALGRLIEAARESIEQAREAGDCEIKDLLRLTGFNFEPISLLLKAEFVSLTETSSPGGAPSQLWQPDMLARYWVDQVAPLAEAVRWQQLRADTDTSLVLTAISFLSAPFMLAEGSILAVVGSVIEFIDLGFNVIQELSQYFASNTEIVFASGAGVAISNARHDAALANAKGWASTAFGLGTSLYFPGSKGLDALLSNGLDALPKLAKLRRVARGLHVTRAMENAGDIATLRPVELPEFSAFALSSRMHAQDVGLGNISAIERKAIAMVEEHGARNRAPRILAEPNRPPVNLVEPYAPNAQIQFTYNSSSPTMASVRPPSAGGFAVPRRSAEVPNALAFIEPENVKVRFADPTGVQREVTLPLGDRLGKGSTSYVYRHGEHSDRFAIRLTIRRKNASPVKMDRFGEDVISHQIQSEHIRPLRVYASHEVTGVEFMGQHVSRVGVVEQLSTAQKRLASQPSGRMNIAQGWAYVGATNDLNRQGYVWLDNKWDNFDLVPLNDGSGRVQIVIFDAGGIARVRPDVAASMGLTVGELARRIQLRINGKFETQIPSMADVDWVKGRIAVRVKTLKRDYGHAFDYQAMGIPGVDQLHFNAHAGEEFSYLAPLFEAAQ